MDSLPRSVKSSLEPIYETRSDPEYGWDQELVGYRPRHKIPAEDRDTAIAILETANTPAPVKLVAREIARLRVMTKSRAGSETDDEIMAAAYLEELARYPADVVTDALRYWTRNEKWWPSWSELRDLLDFRVRRRARMLSALKRNGVEG